MKQNNSNSNKPVSHSVPDPNICLTQRELTGATGSSLSSVEGCKGREELTLRTAIDRGFYASVPDLAKGS